jgi:RHS repeat-associated protein
VYRQIRYTPYGQIRGGSTCGSDGSCREFTGYDTEPISGLEYAVARVYDPALGMFLTQDPMRQYPNPYAYVSWDPLNRTDPTGMSDFGPDPEPVPTGPEIEKITVTATAWQPPGLEVYQVSSFTMQTPSVPSVTAPGLVGVAAQGVGKTVEITYSNGIVQVRKNGSRSWRNNNPGNLRNYPWVKKHGSIGQAGGGAPGKPPFAVFPDMETGEALRENLLRGLRYQGLTLDAMIATYSETDVTAYQAFMREETGLSGNTLNTNFSGAEWNSLFSAMLTYEHFTEGTVSYRGP